MNDALLLVLGGFCLYVGAEWLVRGASGLAAMLGVRPLVIGLTVVAYGTSAPELVVGVGAALSQKGAIALGNSVGSNIANIGLILGLTALIAPPTVERSLRRRDLPVLAASTLAVPVVLLDGRVSRWEAGSLLFCAFAYSAWTLITAKAQNRSALEAVRDASEGAGGPAPRKRLALVATTVVGLLALLGGGKVFVDGAVGVARVLGMSERVVGLTIVAVGTSVPELMTSVIAARRGHPDVAVGNVVGSNIFNTLLILGAAGLVGSVSQPLREVWLDLTALVALTTVGLIAMLKPRITRRVGALLVCSYVAFLLALVLMPPHP